METVNYLGSGRSFAQAQAELASVQKIISHGYRQCMRRTYFLRLMPASQVGTLDDFIASGMVSITQEGDDPIKRLMRLTEEFSQANPELRVHLDLGLTYAGLAQLAVKQDLLEVFRRNSPAFYDGAFTRSIQHLGDTGGSAPQFWASRYQTHPQGETGLVLLAHFPMSKWSDVPQALIDHFEQRLIKALIPGAQAGIALAPIPDQASWVETSMSLDAHGTEHFGYRDGITTPEYSREPNAGRGLHGLGEILLGHPRNDHSNPYADLGLTYKASHHLDLQPVPDADKYKQFFLNSSFGVLRRMQQNVDAFDQWVTQQAQRFFEQDPPSSQMPAGNMPDPLYLSKKWIRSKILGRTPEGIRMTPDLQVQHMQDSYLNAMEQSIRAKEAELEKKTGQKTVLWGKEGGFCGPSEHPLWAKDVQGAGCPFASHIRRMNPQDDPVTPNIARPLLRRGMPYTDGKEKGMSGLFLCADITEQFEHLVGVWAQGPVMGVADDSDCRDPVIGQHEPQNNHFYMNSHRHGPPPNTLAFEDPFVVTQGCAYVWFPAVNTLKEFQQYFDRRGV